MIGLHNITRIENIQEELFGKETDTPIVRKIILHKEQDVLMINGNFINRYAVFIDKHSCELINETKFDSTHHFKFQNNELTVVRDTNITQEEIDEIDDYEDFDSFTIKKYHIEGKQGLFWLIINSCFWIYGDIPPLDLDQLDGLDGLDGLDDLDDLDDDPAEDYDNTNDIDDLYLQVTSAFF
jgi:hypothetical protein